MARKTTAATDRRRPTKKTDADVQASVQPQAVRGEAGIDIVVPMVFPNGQAWLQSYREACKKRGCVATIGERYRSWDLERYFFRGIAKFMPFVRKVHLILSDEGQIPYWLDTTKVHVVLHRDIIPAELLPMFNSSSIEMWLHRIEGLSETFIYCNDDMIATAPMEAVDFFVDGRPVTRLTEKCRSIVGEFLHTCRNSQDVAAGDHDATFAGDVLLRDDHSYAPMLLSVLDATVARHGKEMYDSCSTFREEKNMNQYLYTYEQWLGGMCVNGYHVHRYFSLSSDYDEMVKMLLSGTAGIACFNDSGIGDVNEMRGILFKALQKILGEKCSYEL